MAPIHNNLFFVSCHAVSMLLSQERVGLEGCCALLDALHLIMHAAVNLGCSEISFNGILGSNMKRFQQRFNYHDGRANGIL